MGGSQSQKLEYCDDNPGIAHFDASNSERIKQIKQRDAKRFCQGSEHHWTTAMEPAQEQERSFHIKLELTQPWEGTFMARTGLSSLAGARGAR